MLDISQLENVRKHNGKTTAACPACREAGHDRKGEHLVLFDGETFGCVVFPGDSAGARDHRKTVLRLAGVKGKRPTRTEGEPVKRAFSPLKVPTADGNDTETVILGRFGRSFHTHARTRALAPARKSPEQPSEPSEDIVEIAKRMFRVVAYWDDPDDMDFETWNRLRLIEGILSLRDGKGRIAYTRSQIDSCIIALHLYADDHPKNAEMLTRLHEARESALSAAQLADRTTKGHRA